MSFLNGFSISDLVESINPFFVLGIILLLFVIRLAPGILQGIWRCLRSKVPPVLTVAAQVTGKRESETPRNESQIYYTIYYVTFEDETGGRLEFEVPGEEYSMLAEGDKGRLTYKRTRYRGFDRV